MINPKNKLRLFYKDGVNPVEEFSREVVDYNRDSYTLTLKVGDTIFIGYEKPINSTYIELTTPSNNPGALSLQMMTNSGLVDVAGFDDDTRNLQRSGFLQWDREEESETQIADAPEAGMPSAFYFRLVTDTETEEVVIKGINIVFSDDQDLLRIVPGVTDSAFLQGQASHILQHASARDEILQKFRNRGFYKQGLANATPEMLTPWDLLDIQEIRQGAAYLTLSKIFFNLSDSPDDVWNQKSLFYRAESDRYLNIARASIDIDDDGFKELDEAQRKVKTWTMGR